MLEATGTLQPLPPLVPSAALRDVGTLPNRHLQSQSQFEFLVENIQILLEKNWFFIGVCTLQILDGSDSKESPCNVGNLGWIPGSEGPPEKEMAIHSSILALRIPMDRRAWQATVHRVAKVRPHFVNYIVPDSFLCPQLTLHSPISA